MKKRRITAFGLALFVLMMLATSASGLSLAGEGPDPFPRGEEVAVKVMSYNIHHGVGEDGVLDLNRIAGVIREAGADLVGLQEVDKHYGARSNFEDQAKKLSELLGMHVAFGANLDRDPLEEGQPRRQYGTAVLSKYPIIRSENHFLSSFGSEQRGLLETTINVKGNHVHLFNTHLGLTVQQRLAQVNEILDIARKRQGTKIILGDFNAKPTSQEIATMTAQYNDGFAGMDDAFTYPASPAPTSRIDYIFTSPDVSLTERQVLNGILASDHLPVVGTVVLNREAPFDNGLGE
ncbi:endonuclease/exonuclease/phosphatase family protein [Paenibacillus sp. GYB003]|uniref:endonuclease/exonuclease/phosphatase family protein n=1 Tax=Paenibacillus sp. GYB003 TaxID=2994392 RepID=UPI002F96A71D